jgi:tRNA nucleotidyltransferase/poly(A) polymerase
MYDSKVEATTNNAIKQNLTGIKKISKERILVELLKILNLKSFINFNESTYLKEIFNFIFPEFANLKRLDKLKKILNSSKINLNLLLAILLIDKDSNHEYFCHKYNVSNDIKDDLNLLAKNLNLLQNKKDFFTKDIEKHIYLNDKSHLIKLNILNFASNSEYSFKNFSEAMKNILKSKTHKFHIDGKYLMNKGMSEGVLLGKVLRKIEEEWIENNFKISDNRVQEIIKQNS